MRDILGTHSHVSIAAETGGGTVLNWQMGDREGARRFGHWQRFQANDWADRSTRSLSNQKCGMNRLDLSGLPPFLTRYRTSAQVMTEHDSGVVDAFSAPHLPTPCKLSARSRVFDRLGRTSQPYLKLGESERGGGQRHDACHYRSSLHSVARAAWMRLCCIGNSLYIAKFAPEEVLLNPDQISAVSLLSDRHLSTRLSTSRIIKRGPREFLVDRFPTRPP